MRPLILLAALAPLALGGCAWFTPSSEVKIDQTSFEGHAPPGSNAIAIDGQPGSCMPKRLIALGAQDLKAVTASLTCTHPDGTTESATLGVGEVGASQSQAIVAGTTNKALDTVDKAITLASQGVAAANPATLPLAQRQKAPAALGLPPSTPQVGIDPGGLQ